MTQRELARRLFISPVYLNQMMQGGYTVGMRMAVMIAKELDMDALELIGTVLEGAGQHGT
ncbi:MAG: helix-turn-helix transcriptional regulator [bacterium]|nr:helix-turn-helix transcriptional regulator [bacterium]